MIDISEEELKKKDNSFENNQSEEIIHTDNEKLFDINAIEPSLSKFVSRLRTSEFEQASKILKELPRDALLLDKQNDVEPQNEQEEEGK